MRLLVDWSERLTLAVGCESGCVSSVDILQPPTEVVNVRGGYGCVEGAGVRGSGGRQIL